MEQRLPWSWGLLRVTFEARDPGRQAHLGRDPARISGRSPDSSGPRFPIWDVEELDETGNPEGTG